MAKATYFKFIAELADWLLRYKLNKKGDVIHGWKGGEHANITEFKTRFHLTDDMFIDIEALKMSKKDSLTHAGAVKLQFKLYQQCNGMYDYESPWEHEDIFFLNTSIFPTISKITMQINKMKY